MAQNTDRSVRRQHVTLHEQIQERTKQHAKKSDSLLLHLKDLRARKQKLLEKGSCTRPDRGIISGRRKPHDVNIFINNVKDNIQEYETNIHSLRKLQQARWRRLHRPYNGELGPLSYESWQIPHYYLVRSIVMETVDSFLDMYFQDPVPVSDTHTYRAVAAMQHNEIDRQWSRLNESKAIQLILERLILEETQVLSMEIAGEILAIRKLISSQVDNVIMQQAEIVATKKPKGRPDGHPAFNLVTKTWLMLQMDRRKFKSDIWLHSQPLQSPNSEGLIEPEEEEDVVILKYNQLPVSDPLHVHVSDLQTRYSKWLSEYWQGMATSVMRVPLERRCHGVQIAKLSPNHKYIAIGTGHGDIIVYALWFEPFIAIRGVANVQSQDVPVVSLDWSLDSCRIVSITEAGLVQVWSMQGTPAGKSQLRSLKLKTDGTGFSPLLLTLLAQLDANQSDLMFKSGPFVENEVLSEISVPTHAIFWSSQVSLIGGETGVVVALESGDIMHLHMHKQLASAQDARPLYSARSGGGVNTVADGIEADLLRRHKYPIIQMSTCNNRAWLVSVDERGFICIWQTSPDTESSYGWHRPLSRYRIEMFERMYAPIPNSTSTLHFSDKKQIGSRQDMARERARIEMTIKGMGLGAPWHSDYNDEQYLNTSIYSPHEVTPAGGVFHIIARHADTNLLSTYVTRLYKPTKLYCSKISSCHMSPSGDTLIFMLLYPQYPPKGAHVTILCVDIPEMKVRQIRIQVEMSEMQYSQCSYEDAAWAQIGRVLGVTGCEYVWVSICGEISAYSLNTGQNVLQTMPTDIDYIGCYIEPALLQCPTNAHFTVAGTLNKTLVILYGEQQVHSKNTGITILKVENFHSSEERMLMYKAFQTWQGPINASSDVRVDSVKYSLEGTYHTWVAMRRLVLEHMDIALQSIFGSFSEEQAEANTTKDSLQNYLALME